MKNFEEFKASREKMDPSARKMSDHQWEQAYAAYRSSREKVRGASSSREGSLRKRRSPDSASAGSHGPSSISRSGVLKAHVRAESAYADLRLIVNLLAWIMVGVIVILGFLEMSIYTSLAGGLVALLQAGLHVLAVIVLRLIAQVLIDIPDIALYRACEVRKSMEVSGRPSEN